MRVDEIENLDDTEFTGGDAWLSLLTWEFPRRYPLPGTTFTYSYQLLVGKLIVVAFDGDRRIGAITTNRTPVKWAKNAFTVDVVTTSERYRAQGVIKALYRAMLWRMKITLLAGYSQTSGGKRNWLSLLSMPNVEVKGLIVLDDRSLPPTDIRTTDMRGYEISIADENMDLLMSMGAEHLGSFADTHYFAFDVVPGTGELVPYVKNKLSTIYDGNAQLFARWQE
jgi:hypothetical protein